MSNIYETSVKKPFHLSVGCVLTDENNKVVCHKHTHEKFGVVHTLMRESIEPGESPEQTLTRGLQEEMGATAEIQAYIGSITANDTWFREINQPTPVQKTTIYFLAKLTSIDESKRKADDPESKSELVYLELPELIELMREQSERLKIQDIDESSVLENASKLLAS